MSLVPKRIGPYKIARVLGGGSMGAVFEAQDEKLGRRVALKVLRAEDSARSSRFDRFGREARAAASVIHPNVVTIFDIGEADDLCYIAMELCEGPDLAAYLAARGPLPHREAVELILPVISAVAAAHACGVIHRDLKPGNIVVTELAGALHPKVVDFGISKIESDAPLTRTGVSMGTLHYASPEQVRSAKHVDQRTDVYALGVILYECLTNRRPFVSGDSIAVLEAIMTAAVPPPSEIQPEVPEALDRIVLRALSRSLDSRFATAEALGAALLPFAREEKRRMWPAFAAAQVESERAAPPLLRTMLATEAPPAAAPRRVSAGRAAAVIALLTLLFSAWYFTREDPPAAVATHPLESVEEIEAPKPYPVPLEQVLPPPPPAAEAARRTRRSPAERKPEPKPVWGDNGAPIIE